MNPITRPDWAHPQQSLPPAPALFYPESHIDWPSLCCTPIIDPTAFVAENAVVNGCVKIGPRASIWHHCVLRGDIEWIEVGTESNVQDGSILHTAPGLPCIIGNQVTIGHRAVVHGCVVEDGAMIAISATVLNGCVIGAGALIAAGAVVLEGTHVPPNTLWAGCPARQIKPLNPQQQERLAVTFQHYVNQTAAQAALAQLPRPAGNG